jgi:16S rRNA (cytosine1402-N4)-methyltransferase
MVREVLDVLAPERGGVFFDGTAGGGGHAEAILERGAEARVMAVDRDPAAVEEARRRLDRFGPRAEVHRSEFDVAAASLAVPLAGALLDLGVSSRQLDDADRGFTFEPGAPLDMRMGGEEQHGPTGVDLLNGWSEGALADLFHAYAEEPRARRLAAEIVRRRQNRPFATSDDLVAAARAVLGPGMRPADKARIFQALRIAVNAELEKLDRALPVLRDALAPGGVLAVLSYHSLEDRATKHAFREWSRDCVCPPGLPVCRSRGRRLGDVLTRKPTRPSDEEVAANPRSRSARLRAWRRAA